ncbi:MAG: PorV/PorQ family protein [Bacteroidales bacterium]|jgi:hypothetical protein|nr:PorV/PorQ family protein [Bacteroidales bacterium]MBQ4477243.1 PorV/PorQ family protein [Bacteroidales bacterium]MBR4453090.1 PorV/PorQ family protein [Bacteroidales bacterium]
MKKLYRAILAVTLVAAMMFTSQNAQAGNKDRLGQAAAGYLLVNPWAGTNGWGGVGVSSTKGIQATFTNVAGMAFTRKTELAYSNTLYNVGAKLQMNGFGIVQALSKDGYAGNIAVTAAIMSTGEIEKTTVDQPEGGMGTYKWTALNLAISYARSFSDAVHAGVTIRIVNESMSNASATGFAIDAGVQYVAGRNDQFQLGVVMKNIGLPMAYKGNGMSIRGTGAADRNSILHTLSTPSEASEMPALLALGLSYDFLFAGKSTTSSTESGTKARVTRATAAHRLTLAGSFTANAYSRDQFSFGIEYSLMDYFQVRGGYVFEAGMFNASTSTSNFTGPTAGVSLLAPLAKKSVNPSSRLAIDYSYRFTREYKGCHGIGIRLIL